MAETATTVHIVIITGLSGAGRSQAANVLEDIGYFVVDNLPIELIPGLAEAVEAVDGSRSKIAVVVDSRTGMDASKLDTALMDLHRDGLPTIVLFLNADDRILARRFEESRRPHPIAASSLLESIAAERAAFENVRAAADVVVDTSELSVHQLKDRLTTAFADAESQTSMRVDVTSFGFKRGIPRVADLMFDVRFLPNPHWVEELRPLTGRDEPVRSFVFSHDEAGVFLDKVNDMLDFLIPQYELEGKSYLTIAVGCTGGKHRSVALTEAIASHLGDLGVDTTVHHRDMPT